ncbi:DUF3857 domain-containing transglutaminase family protein [Desulfurobacterium sp.]
MRLLFILFFFVSSVTASAATTMYSAKILYDRVTVKFYPDGRKKWIEESAVKILNRQGVSKFGEVTIPFSTEHQKLKILYAYTELPDGKKVKPSKDAFNIVYPPFQSFAPIYSDLKYQTISMPAVKPGAVIKYAFELDTVEPYMEGEFWTEDFLQTVYPADEVFFKVYIPAGKEVKCRKYNLHSKFSVTREGNYSVYSLDLKDVPPIQKEPSMPPIEEFLKKVAFTSIKSWNKVAEWYSGLALNATIPDDFVKKVTLGIVKDKNNTEEKIRAIYNFVSQNIRYVGLEFGINGYKPHTASSILKNRYGDCKDHATLLIAMLRVIGVKGYPVLIPTSDIANMDISMPMPTAFNHEIAAIRWHGKWLFLDTTSDNVPFGELPVMDQGRKVLIVDLENGKAILSETPIFPSSSNVEGFSGNFKMDENGALQGNMKFYYSGVYAHRERAVLLSMENQRQIERFLENNAVSVIPGFDVDNYTISDYKDINRKKIYYSVNGKASIFATKTKHLMLFHVPAPCYLKLIGLVAPKKRKYPYVIGYKMMKRSSVSIAIPSGYTLFFLPENFNYSSDIGSISVWWSSKENGKIRFNMEMVLKKDKISPEDYKELKKLFNLTVKTLQNQVIILGKESKR